MGYNLSFLQKTANAMTDLFTYDDGSKISKSRKRRLGTEIAGVMQYVAHKLKPNALFVGPNDPHFQDMFDLLEQEKICFPDSLIVIAKANGESYSKRTIRRWDNATCKDKFLSHIIADMVFAEDDDIATTIRERLSERLEGEFASRHAAICVDPKSDEWKDFYSWLRSVGGVVYPNSTKYILLPNGESYSKKGRHQHDIVRHDVEKEWICQPAQSRGRNRPKRLRDVDAKLNQLSSSPKDADVDVELLTNKFAKTLIFRRPQPVERDRVCPVGKDRKFRVTQ